MIITACLYGCYKLSKYVAKKAGGAISGNKIKVIERMALGQDKLIAICNICGSYYLIGVSSQSIKILAQLDAQHFAEEEAPTKQSFKEILQNFKNSGKKIDL